MPRLPHPPWWLKVAAIVVLALVALTAWALSSPAGSSPDDDRHLPAIWCGLGASPGVCEPVSPGMAEVPVRTITAPVCFAFKPEVSAACQEDRFALLSQQPRQAGNYSYLDQTPGMFYRAMSLLKGDSLESSVLRMRIANALIAIAMVGLTILLAERWLRPAIGLAWIVTAVPLGLFIIPSTNPSSWAIIGIGTYWALLITGFEAQDARRRRAAAALAVAAAALAAGARTDAAAFLIVVTLAVLALVRADRGLKRRRGGIGVIAAVVGIALGTIAFLTSDQAAVATTGLQTGQEPPFTGLTLLFRNAVNLPSLWYGALGEWNLGWLDTPMPAVVAFAVGAAFCALLFTGFGSLDIGKAVGLALLIATLSALPLWILQRSAREIGYEVQPRYFLPLMFVLLGVALVRARPRAPLSLAPAQRWSLIAGLSIAQGLALAYQVRRYTSGIDGSLINIDSQREWWSTSAASPLTVILIGAMAYFLLAWVVVRWTATTSARDAPPSST